jgi:hypothetical protein
MTVKDFEYYAQNPDELPTDPAAIDALLTGDQPQEEPAAEPEQPTEEGVTEAPPSLETEASAEETPAPIESKDGKHSIPYAVLQSEREKRRAAEQVQQELMQRIAEIESKLASSGQGAPVESSAVAELLSDESISEMVVDFPSIKPMIDYTKQLEGKLAQFEQRFAEVEQIEMSRQQAQAVKQQAEVRQEIDANPTLRYWETKDPEKWQAALEADNQLRSLPAIERLSLGERFSKVVSVVEAIYGATELPPEFAPRQEPPKDLSAKVKKAVESAETFKPKTIGDMPGGTVSSSDPIEAMFDQTPAKLAAMMSRMTPDQITELLAKAG